jgi:UDP-N-acetylglucosamine 3-dehydrogenase
MTQPLRAGLIGLGSMGRNHARVLNSLDGVELVGIADPGDVTAEGVGAEVVSSVDDLITKGIDYAVVASPTSHHRELGLALAAAGIHTLIEKPLAPSVDEAMQLTAAFEGAGLVAAVGHIERYNPALRAARIRLANGDLGEVFQVTTRRQSPFPVRIADVGVVMDLATHDIDLTSWVSGRRFTSVTAHTASKSGRTHEDLVAFIATLGGDVISSHLVNWLTPVKERIATFTGERGTFVVDLLSADLTFWANGTVDMDWTEIALFRGVSEGDITRYAIPKPEPLRVEHEQFRDAVLGEPADIVTMREGAETVRVAHAVLQSAALGRSIDLAGSER